MLEALQSSKGKKERNDRVFVVPDRSPFEGNLQDIRRLPSRAIKELETPRSRGDWALFNTLHQREHRSAGDGRQSPDKTGRHAEGYIAFALGRIEQVRMASRHQEPRQHARGDHDGGSGRGCRAMAKIGRVKWS